MWPDQSQNTPKENTPSGTSLTAPSFNLELLWRAFNNVDHPFRHQNKDQFDSD